MATEIYSTIRSSGGDYPSFSAAAADNYGATSQDLVSNDEYILCEMGNDWSGDGLEDDIFINGWTTDATRNITIRALSGHGTDGTIGSGARVWRDASYGANVLAINSSNVYIGGQGQGIEATHLRELQYIWAPGNVSNVTFDSILMHKPLSGAARSVVFFSNTSASNNTFINCIFMATGTTTSSYYLIKLEGSGKIYNCSIINDTTQTFLGAWARSSASWDVRNTFVAGSGAYSTYWVSSAGWNGSCTHNATSNSTDDAPGGNSQTSVSSSDFVDEVDYVPTSSGKLQAGNGTDLSATFNYDISGATRSGSFTIGAFNEPAASGWSGKLGKITNIAKIGKVSTSNIAKVGKVP